MFVRCKKKFQFKVYLGNFIQWNSKAVARFSSLIDYSQMYLILSKRDF